MVGAQVKRLLMKYFKKIKSIMISISLGLKRLRGLSHNPWWCQAKRNLIVLSWTISLVQRMAKRNLNMCKSILFRWRRLHFWLSLENVWRLILVKSQIMLLQSALVTCYQIKVRYALASISGLSDFSLYVVISRPTIIILKRETHSGTEYTKNLCSNKKLVAYRH